MIEGIAMKEIPNRYAVYSALDTTMKLSDRFNQLVGVLFIGLDELPAKSGELEYTQEKYLLQTVYKRLKGSLQNGEIPGWMDWDKFVVILPDAWDDEAAMKTAKRIIRVLAPPYFANGTEIILSFRIGLSIYPWDSTHMKEALENAVMAAARAEKLGENRIALYSYEFDVGSLENYLLYCDLHESLFLNKFVLWFQPQIDFHTRQIAGMEAQIYWRQSETELIPPEEFLPFAEKNSLIIPIGDWALHEACRQNKLWQDSGAAPFKVTVNLSEQQLLLPNLVQRVELVLNETKLEACWLELQISEAALTRHAVQAAAKLERLNAMGVNISVDHFATTCRSIDYVFGLPLKSLKIDWSFFSEKEEDIEATMSLVRQAHKLGIEAAVRGVEREDQVESLQRVGFDRAQGYLFGGPLEAGKTESLVRDRTHDV